MYIYTYTNIYIHIYVYMHVCICIFIYIFTKFCPTHMKLPDEIHMCNFLRIHTFVQHM